MKKFWKLSTLIVIFLGFPLLAWAGYITATETYAFWSHGIEKKASVIGLQHTSSPPRAGTTYYYIMEIDGVRLTKDFRVQLPVGGGISVLVIPERPREIMPGSRNSSLFEIFSYSIGGHVIASLVLATYVFLLVATPWLVYKVWPVRREILDDFLKS